MACPEPWHHTLQVKGYVSDHIRWLRGSFNHCLQSVHLQYFVLGQTCPNCHSPERGFCCPILSSKIDRTCHYCSIPLKDSRGALCLQFSNSETQHCLGPAWLHLRLTQSTQKSAKSKEETPRAAPAPAAPPKSGADFLQQMILYMHTMYIYINYCYILLLLLLLLYYYCYLLFLFLLYSAIMFVIGITVIIIILFRVLFS